MASKRSGVDVDKWDYFARDCDHLGNAMKKYHMGYLHSKGLTPPYYKSGRYIQ